MDKNVNASGYDLYEITENEWILNVKGGALFVGSFKKVVKHAVLRMGFQLSEIEFAVNEMVRLGHNAAHFGIHKSFIFTFQKEFSNVKKVG